VRYTSCMNHSLLCFFLSLLTGIFATSARAQINPTGEQIGSTRKDSIPEGVMPLDTPVPMTYVLLVNPNEFLSFEDTFVWEDNKHFPLAGYQAHLGNYGSASRSLAPIISSPIGFSPGWFQYDPYYIQEETFRYYNQDVPVAKIKYSQGGQEDTYLTLDFGRSFARGLSLSIAYDRINQVGEFDHQRQKNTGFSIGVWHNAPNGKYDAFYNYLNNASVTQENGGISAPELIGQDNVPDIYVPIFLTSNVNTAISTHKQRTFMTKQIIHLLPDSSDFGMDVWLKGSFSARLFKYVDEDTELALDYYNPLYLTDDRGIRQYTYIRENQWSIGIALPWAAAHSTLNASLKYRRINLEQEPVTRKINELYFDVSGIFQWVDPLVLQGDLSLGLGQAQGVFSFNASADLNIGPLGYLRGDWSLISRKPYMIESALYVSQEPIYLTDFSNPLLSEIGVEWDWEKQDFQAGIKWLVYDNFIYFDSIAFPQQIGESFSLRRFYLSKGFDYRKFGLRGSVFWQPDPRPELAVPEIWYSASAYGRINVFEKKVVLMPGLDVIYNGDFTGITYFPVNGSYHLTNGTAIPDAFRIDAALGLQINFIKAFLCMEDLVGLFKDRVLYQADYYPHYRGYFRIGVEAGFFN
jgi:hypothetical protein